MLHHDRWNQGTKKQIHFGISLEFTLVAKWNARFIKKSQSVKKWYTILSMQEFQTQTSVRSDRESLHPRTLTPWPSTAGIIARDVTMVKLIRRAISIGAIHEFITLLMPPSCFNFALDTDQKVAGTWYKIGLRHFPDLPEYCCAWIEVR